MHNVSASCTAFIKCIYVYKMLRIQWAKHTHRTIMCFVVSIVEALPKFQGCYPGNFLEFLLMEWQRRKFCQSHSQCNYLFGVSSKVARYIIVMAYIVELFSGAICLTIFTWLNNPLLFCNVAEEFETLRKERGLLSQVKIVEQIAHGRKFSNILYRSTVFSSREWLFGNWTNERTRDWGLVILEPVIRLPWSSCCFSFI